MPLPPQNFLYCTFIINTQNGLNNANLDDLFLVPITKYVTLPRWLSDGQIGLIRTPKYLHTENTNKNGWLSSYFERA